MHDIMNSKGIQAEKSWWELWHNINDYSNLTEKEPDKMEKEFDEASKACDYYWDMINNRSKY